MRVTIHSFHILFGFFLSLYSATKRACSTGYYGSVVGAAVVVGYCSSWTRYFRANIFFPLSNPNKNVYIITIQPKFSFIFFFHCLFLISFAIKQTGVYGDVQRVKILYNKKDSALIQMAEPHQAYLGEYLVNII